jgi:hypothetical protein
MSKNKVRILAPNTYTLDTDGKWQIDYTFHAYGRTEGVCGIIISDHDYPALVAHQLLSKVVDEFLSKHPRSTWANSNPTLPFPELKDYIVKYQDPQQADSIMKIQKELDETKIVLHKTIESVLQRGEKIDDLVAKSDGLSAQSKMFYSEWPFFFLFCRGFTIVWLYWVWEFERAASEREAMWDANDQTAQAKKQNSCCVLM